MDRKIASRFGDIHLIPFYVFAALFLVVCKPHLDYPPETVLSAILKILPIISLAGFVYLKSNDETYFGLIYSNFMTYGLLLSSLGDICLVWRETLFLPGASFFAIAHVFYILGLVKKYTGSKHKALFFYISMSIFLFVSTNIDSCVDKVVIFVYNGLLSTFVFLAVARFENERSVSAKLGAIGGLLFMFSDFIILIDKCRFGIYGSEFLVMLTYFSAQLCLALSTVRIGN